MSYYLITVKTKGGKLGARVGGKKKFTITTVTGASLAHYIKENAHKVESIKVRYVEDVEAK